MEKAEIRQMINGPESFTPDMHAVLGEVPEVSYCNVLFSISTLPHKTNGKECYEGMVWGCGL